MDFGVPFTFVFKDPQWFKKLALNGLLLFVPILGGFYSTGWSLEIVRQLIFHEKVKIPDIQLEKFFIRGLIYSLIIFIYSLPLLLLLGIIFALIPLTMMISEDTAVLGMLISFTLMSILVFPISLIYNFLFPAISINFLLADEKFAGGFDFSKIFGLIKKRPSAFFLCMLGILLASYIANMGAYLLIVGMFITMPYYFLVFGHFVGQTYIMATNEEPTPVTFII